MPSPSPYAELEIALHRQDASYLVEMRFTDPTSQAELPPARGSAPLDPVDLSQHHLDPDAYGAALTEALFDDPDCRRFYDRVQQTVQTSERRLRLRLAVGPDAPELASLRWELLVDPETQNRLATSERTLFSRFMQSSDWRPIRLRPKTDLRAVIAVAAATDLDRYKLANIDLEGEVERARSNLRGMDVTVVGDYQPLTLERLVDSLRGGIDVLYLVCHGVLRRSTGEPFLFLQDAQGAVARVPATDLGERISELTDPPRLVVLASCESGGTEESVDPSGQGTAQASLAPRLAAAGVPAVLAMQGKISIETVEHAMPVFFRELSKDGQIDRAMAVARGTVRQRPDSWMPALYLRLKGGRIWYVPGFGDADDTFKKWKSMVRSVRRGTFVPIVGPEVGATSRGSHGQQAEALATAHGFPLSPHQRTDLAKVSQFISVHESRSFAHQEVMHQLRERLRSQHPHGEADDLKSLFKTAVRERYGDPKDAFRILANLGASVLVNANADPMLPLALAEAGHTPKVLFSNWRKTKDNHPREPAYEGSPTPRSPIVYCAFGFLPKPESMVLTEDDFIDYLIAAADYKLMPRVVRGTLVKSSLLFLGFSLEALTFRVLFRQIMALDGSAQLSDYAHVGVQIDPAESELDDVEQARAYLEEYFAAGRGAPPIDIYWGSATDFLRELQQRLDDMPEETPAAPVSDDGDEDDWVSF